jgi:hypothetical protein
VVYSKNKQRLRSLQIQGAPLNGGGEAYDDQCCVYGALDIDGKGWVMEVCRWTCSRHRILKSSGHFRCRLAPNFVSDMAFAEMRLAIASLCGAAARVLLRRNAGKSSWRKTVSN